MNTVILTCTAIVHKNIVVARNNLDDRITDYVNAINFWRECPQIDNVIVVDNSGFDFSNFFDINDNKIEFLSFNAGDSFNFELGKGFGEYLILKYAVDNSKILGRSTNVFKCTGRYTIKNAREIVSKCLSGTDINADLSRNLSWADSRFFAAKLDFYNIAMPYLASINEKHGLYMEMSLAQAIHAYMAIGHKWNLLPVVPLFQGYYGRDNLKYSESALKFFVKKILKKLKSMAINIRY